MTSIIKQLEEKKDSLNIEFYKPVNEEIVDRFEKEYITLPTEYLDFIRKSDGLGATEVFDCMIYSLKDTKDVLESSIKMHTSDLDKGLLHVGCFWEDSLFVDQNNSVYMSFQGIGKPVCLNMSFKEFLQNCIDRDFELFWDENIQIIEEV